MPSQTLYVSKPILNIGGAAASAELLKDVLQISVEESLHLPTMFTLVVHNAYVSASDRSQPWRNEKYFKIGDLIEIGFESSTTEDKEFAVSEKDFLMQGEITAIEVNFTNTSAAHLIIRGYDVSHRLHRGRYNRSFLNTTDSDIVRKIAAEVGIAIAQIDDSGAPHEYVFQENQTNMEFLRERAARLGFELFVQDNKLYFRAPKSTTSLTLDWLIDISSFNVRVTSAEQVSAVEVKSWDYSKKQLIQETAKAEQVVTTIGSGKGSKTSTAFRPGTPKMRIVDQPVFSANEAKKMAQALCNELGGEYIHADAKAEGNPEIRPGRVVAIKGLGNRYSGQYYITETRHLYSERVYRTDFGVRGLREGNLLSTIAPQTRLQPGQTLMVGIVTNNKDPKGWGRVKVKLPTLTEQDESHWARVIGLGASNDRGFYCLPEINDEVLVGFEHGDIHRPYIIGGVWNGRDKTVEPINNTVQNGKVRLRTIKTRVGHLIRFIEEDGQGTKTGIEIQTASGHWIHLNDSDRYVEVKTQGRHRIRLDDRRGRVEVRTTAGHQIRMEDRGVPPAISISSIGNLSLNARGQLSLNAPVVTLDARAKMLFNAPIVSLNATAQMSLNANVSVLFRSPVLGLATPTVFLGGVLIPPPASTAALAPLIVASQAANVRLP
ncbi:VgrG-related protein [Pseudanabaenaceae cyanobacterium LEGE 13415]|nr:VgrG-related protein [Pseudanabaenaceae cyanobacterium LEGE 13415]